MTLPRKRRQNRKSGVPSSARSKRRGPDGTEVDPNDACQAASKPSSKRRCPQNNRRKTQPEKGPLQENAASAEEKLVHRRMVISNGILPLKDEDHFVIQVLSWKPIEPMTIVRGLRMEGTNATSEVEIVFDRSVNKIDLHKATQLKICEPWQEFDLPTSKTFICSIVTE